MNIKNKIIVAIGMVATSVVFYFGIMHLYHSAHQQQKFYQADFMPKFKITYLQQPNITAPEVLLCDYSQDDFYKNNEDNCHELSKIYGQLIDKGYMAPVYVAFAGEQFGYGLFADTAIQKGEMIGEYTGNLIKESDVTEDNRYLFYYPSVHNINSENPISFFVDAEVAGNFTRFANHAAKPNAERRYVAHNGTWRIIFIAVKNIAKDEQIFIDYGSEYWKDKQQPVEVLLD